MPLSELGNIGIGADAGLAARAAGAQMELDQAIRDRQKAAAVVRGVRPAGPLKVAAGLKPAKETQAQAQARLAREMAAKGKVMTPQTGAQAKAANEAARSEKDRKQFADTIRNVSESTLFDMIQAVARQEKVGSTEYAQVRGYGAEIGKEAERRYGKDKAKQMLDAAYAKKPASAPATVADPLTGKTNVAPVEVKGGAIVVATSASPSFLSRFGLPLAAVAAIGGFMWWRRRRA